MCQGSHTGSVFISVFHWLVSGLLSSIVHISSPGFVTKLTCILLHIVTPSLDFNFLSIELESGTQALLLTQKVISMILECIIYKKTHHIHKL